MNAVSSIFGGSAPGQVQSPLSQAQIAQQYGNLTQGQDQQQALLAALQGQNALTNQNNIYSQLQQIAQGQGPNPAQAMLNQATGQNVANQAALMAGQRGAAANPALIARMAAQQGANTQQQAIGQGATMQANQALNALNAAGNMANTQAGQLLNTQQQFNQNALQGLNTGVQAQNSANATNAQAQQAQAQMQGNVLTGLAGAAGAGLGLLGGGGALASTAANSSGMGLNPKYSVMAAHGGMISAPMPPPNQTVQVQGSTVNTGPRSHYARLMMANGGKVPALVSPGEQYLPPQTAKAVAQGKAAPLSSGVRIPGTPAVKGDSYANDTVPMMLQSGGIIIPNSIMQSKDAEKKAAEFVRRVLQNKLPNKK